MTMVNSGLKGLIDLCSGSIVGVDVHMYTSLHAAWLIPPYMWITNQTNNETKNSPAVGARPPVDGWSSQGLLI